MPCLWWSSCMLLICLHKARLPKQRHMLYSSTTTTTTTTTKPKTTTRRKTVMFITGEKVQIHKFLSFNLVTSYRCCHCLMYIDAHWYDHASNAIASSLPHSSGDTLGLKYLYISQIQRYFFIWVALSLTSLIIHIVIYKESVSLPFFS